MGKILAAPERDHGFDSWVEPTKVSRWKPLNPDSRIWTTPIQPKREAITQTDLLVKIYRNRKNRPEPSQAEPDNEPVDGVLPDEDAVEADPQTTGPVESQGRIIKIETPDDILF